MVRFIGALAVVCGLVLNTGDVQAQWGPWTWWDAGVAGYARLPLRTGNVPTPPYFALHPPVYYQAITPRSYGQSPFAALPWCKCPESDGLSPRPLRVVNPHVRTSVPDSIPIARQRSAPMLIINPHCQPPSDSNDSGPIAVR